MKALVVVDMQNDFVSGALGSEYAKAIVNGVAKKIEEARERGDQIYFTLDTHDKNYLETEEGKNLPVMHCIKGTEGHQLIDAIEKISTHDDIFVEKAAFGSPQLAKSIAGKGSEIEEVELVGSCTDMSVISNAMLLKAYAPGTPIAVISGLCAGISPQGHENALRAMQACHIKIK